MHARGHSGRPQRIDEVRVATNWGNVTGGTPTLPVTISSDPASRTVKAGDRASVDFGAQSKTLTASEPVEPGTNRSSGLGVVGLLLLLGGIGLGYYAYRSNQPKSKLKGSPLDRR